MLCAKTVQSIIAMHCQEDYFIHIIVHPCSPDFAKVLKSMTRRSSDLKAIRRRSGNPTVLPLALPPPLFDCGQLTARVCWCEASSVGVVQCNACTVSVQTYHWNLFQKYIEVHLRGLGWVVQGTNMYGWHCLSIIGRDSWEFLPEGGALPRKLTLGPKEKLTLPPSHRLKVKLKWNWKYSS